MMTQAACLEYFGRLLLFSPQAAGSVLRPEPKLQTLSHASLSFNLAHTLRQNINTINVVRHQFLKTYCGDSRPVFRTNAKEVLEGT